MVRVWLAARQRLLPAVLALLAFALMVSGASAHEHRKVGNDQFIVGFLTEPAIVEEPNGLDLRVQTADGKPVEGLANTLKAEVKYGGQTMPLTLGPVFNQPGAYAAHFIPTATGAYTFHIFGTLGQTPINESFTSGPNTFAEVASRSAVSFPDKVEPVGQVQQTASAAGDTATSARTLGIVGIVVGALGLIVGLTGLLIARRRPVALAVDQPRVARTDAGEHPGAGGA